MLYHLQRVDFAHLVTGDGDVRQPADAVPQHADACAVWLHACTAGPGGHHPDDARTHATWDGSDLRQLPGPGEI